MGARRVGPGSAGGRGKRSRADAGARHAAGRGSIPAVAGCVCPWWLGYLLVTPLRRLWQDPRTLLAPYVCEGMTVLEPGPGMGFFTLELARRVGSTGRVVAIDVQPRMLATLRRRAERAGLGARIETRQASGADLGVGDLAGRAGFVLAFALVHELPDAAAFFAQVGRALAPGGRVLVAEPVGHVSAEEMGRTLDAARAAGLAVVGSPAIRSSRTALLAAG
jgi:SAM-dependent methyltransferase